MHGNVKRLAPGSGASTLPTIITGVNSNGPSPTGQTSLAIDTGKPYTFVTATYLNSKTIDGSVSVFTETRTKPIVNPSEYSSILASETGLHSSSVQSTSASSAAASSTGAAKQSGSSNLGTLIPAIVVPIAVVFIGSFVAFWIIMRKRHKKQLKEEPEFVMATKAEKPISRGNSASSGHSSTRELVPMSKLEKEVMVTTTDVKRSSIDMFPPSYTVQGDIGVARPMTPPDKKNAADKKQYKNFSSVRPGTGNSNRNRSQSTSHGRERSESRSGSRNGPTHRTNQGPPHSTRGPIGQAFNQPVSGSRSPPRLPAVQTSNSMGNMLQAPTLSKSGDPPTPTGAFNGASPISSYSPIVKDVPNMAGITIESKSKAGPAPLPLKNVNAHVSRGTDSPIDDSVLSRENMRIARLANSSRLGFSDSPVEPEFSQRLGQSDRSLSPLTETHSRSDGSATSPRLPPPLSRDDMPAPNRPFARGPDSPAAGSSIYPSPSIGTGATPRLPQYGIGPSATSLAMSDANTIGVASSTAQPQRASIISRISSDDGYVDMELDAKSDVSSLDERDRWEMESDARAGSRLAGGYNTHNTNDGDVSPVAGPGTHVSSNSSGNAKPNIRDRDSEGPFVLSRY